MGDIRMDKPQQDMELLESLFVLVEPGMREKTRIIRFVRSFGINAFLQSLTLFEFSTETQNKLNHYRQICNYLDIHEMGNLKTGN